jgi:hypothetical protein
LICRKIPLPFSPQNQGKLSGSGHPRLRRPPAPVEIKVLKEPGKNEPDAVLTA